MFLRFRSCVAFSILTVACGADSVEPLPALDASTLDDAGITSPGDGEDAGAQSPPRDAGSGHTPDADGPKPPTSTGPGDWVAGDYPPDLHAQTYLELENLVGQPGKVRGFKVHVPPSYDPNVPTPVVFAFHASQMNAVGFAVDAIGFPAQSDREGFIAIMPNGLQEDGLGGGWNAGTCCGEAAKQNLDDVGFTRAVLAEVGSHVNLDLTRIYAMGLSTGADFSHRLACEASDIFAAIAPLAGSICTPELAAEPGLDDTPFTTCAPSHPVAVLAMHGSADGFVPYASLERTLAAWAERNGCATASQLAQQPESGGDTTCITYAGCNEGVEVTGCSVAEGGHCWFGSETCGTGVPLIGNLVVGNNSDWLDASEAAWAFLSRFRRDL